MVIMPEPEEQRHGAGDNEEGARELKTIPQLAPDVGMSRQQLHRLRVTDPAFPSPRRVPGSTREKFDLHEVRAYLKGRVLRPGERTDLKAKRKQQEQQGGAPGDEDAPDSRPSGGDDTTE
jgi:hypothetical protein